MNKHYATFLSEDRQKEFNQYLEESAREGNKMRNNLLYFMVGFYSIAILAIGILIGLDLLIILLQVLFVIIIFISINRFLLKRKNQNYYKTWKKLLNLPENWIPPHEYVYHVMKEIRKHSSTHPARDLFNHLEDHNRYSIFQYMLKNEIKLHCDYEKPDFSKYFLFWIFLGLMIAIGVILNNYVFKLIDPSISLVISIINLIYMMILLIRRILVGKNDDPILYFLNSRNYDVLENLNNRIELTLDLLETLPLNEPQE